MSSTICNLPWGPGLPWGVLVECEREHKHTGAHRVYNSKGAVTQEWTGRATTEELAAMPAPIREKTRA